MPATGKDNKTIRFTLRKAEKLRHRKLVDALFREGCRLYDFPLQLIYRKVDKETLSSEFRCGLPPRISPLQMMITVPKKKRRKAVDRVVMRRRIREAYRLSRLHILEKLGDEGKQALSMAFIYMATENVPFSVVRDKMENLLAKLDRQL